MAFERIRTLGGALGSYARKIVRWGIETGTSIAETLGIIKPMAPEVTLEAAAREWGEVSVGEGRQEQFAGLGATQGVPIDWFEESEIPWDKPLAYKVSIYGRDLATGRFARQEMDITVSRPLTTEEALDEAAIRVGLEGVSPTFDIFDIKLVGASRRAGEEWRW